MSTSGLDVRGAVPVPWAARRAGSATVRDASLRQPPWRDELRLILAVTGALAIVFLPAALAVVEAPSLAFLAFALAVTTDWALSVVLQVATLRGIRAHPQLVRLPLVVQFIVLAVAAVTFKLLSDIFTGPFAERAHLSTSDDWRSAAATWTSVLVGAYLLAEREGRSRQALAARRLADVQRAQVRARREVVDGQLRAMQARVDPQFFFDTLDAVEALYRDDVARAESLLDELVVFLRAALPHVDASSSVLARELELATSAARIDALASGHVRALEVDVPSELMRLPFPAGVLLPLLQGALVAAADRNRVGVGVRAELVGARKGGDASMRLTVATPEPPPPATCERVRESLRALFGDAAALSVAAVSADRFDIVVSLPHDQP